MSPSKLTGQVLLADRHGATQDFVRKVLASPGWSVTAAATETELFRGIAEHRPDVVLLNANIADTSLRDLCLKLRAAFHDLRPAIILLVSQDARSLIPVGFAAGVDDCLTAPFYPEELLARILTPVRLSRLERSLGQNVDLANVSVQLEQVARLRSYLSPVLVESVMASDPAAPFGAVARRKRITFLFSDIRGFTQMADDLPPEMVSDVLSEYFTHVQRIISEHGGCINKFLGDGLLVIFGDPAPDKHHKLKAMLAALEIREFVKEFSARLHFLPSPFAIGIGINSGRATVGNFGTQTQIDYTAVGPAVNLAARLQGLAQNGEVVAAADTYEDYGDEVIISNERLAQVKGLKEPVKVADIMGVKR